jgi:hypothetical protein
MTISDDIKSAREMLAQARGAVAPAIKDAKDTAIAVVVEVDKLRAETAAMRSDLANLTNGGPALDEPVGATVIPPVSM